VLIEQDTGYNVAYWNLHERIATTDENNNWLIVNPSTAQTGKLYFFHYSGYDPSRPHEVSKYQTRFAFASATDPEGAQTRIARPDALPLFELYREQLLLNQNDRYRQYPCVYIKPPVVLRYQRIRKLLSAPLNRLITLLES
jgi:hypothetical protein